MSGAATFLALGDCLIRDAATFRGAASLLFHNPDGRFPEFRGRDLISAGPVVFQNYTQPQTTLAQVERTLNRWLSPYPPAWILLSVGSQDLLDPYFDADTTVSAFARVLETLTGRYPDAQLAVLNLVDPSDGRGQWPGDRPIAAPSRQYFSSRIDWLNPILRELSGDRLVDVYSHFRGHSSGLFERGNQPSALGASEVRRLVWQRWSRQPVCC